MNRRSFAKQAQRQTASALPGCQVIELTIPDLVGEVFEATPPQVRGRLLEPLLRPLGLMSLFGIAGGVFAKVKLQSGWKDLEGLTEDIQLVRAADVAALVDHVQQFSAEAMDGLGQAMAAMPGLSGSAAAVLLVALLVRRASGRSAAARGAEPGVPGTGTGTGGGAAASMALAS